MEGSCQDLILAMPGCHSCISRVKFGLRTFRGSGSLDGRHAVHSTTDLLNAEAPCTMQAKKTWHHTLPPPMGAFSLVRQR